VHHRSERGVFVTTTEFSTPAQELAAAHDIELVDGARLTTLLARVVR